MAGGGREGALGQVAGTTGGFAYLVQPPFLPALGPSLQVWDLGRGFCARSVPCTKMPNALSISRDGNTIATGAAASRRQCLCLCLCCDVCVVRSRPGWPASCVLRRLPQQQDHLSPTCSSRWDVPAAHCPSCSTHALRGALLLAHFHLSCGHHFHRPHRRRGEPVGCAPGERMAQADCTGMP